MDPVHTEDCNIIYKGPTEQIGDLWCHRVHPGLVCITYELTPGELEIIKAGGRVQLHIMKEPIPSISLGVVDKESSEPVAPHGWKIDKNPGDKISEEEAHGETQEDIAEGKETSVLDEISGPPSGEAADAVSA